MKLSALFRLFAVAGVLALWWPATGADASDLFAEHRITVSANRDNQPSLGNSGQSDIVVYATGANELSASDIYYSVLVDGALSGSPVLVATGSADYRYNDISGDYIVYAAYPSTGSSSGAVMLYRISTAQTRPIDSAAVLGKPHICGKHVIWTEGDSASTQLMYFNIDWLGTADTAVVVAGPAPTVADAEVGDRFIVWSDFDGNDFNVRAYDFTYDYVFDVAASPGENETQPSTDGPWIFFQQRQLLYDESTIEGTNFDTYDFVTVADNGVLNYHPYVSGDVVLYESDITGQRDLFVYDLPTEMSFRLTTNGVEAGSSCLNGNLAGYVDSRFGSADVYVATLPVSVCCLGRAGNVDGDPDDEINVSDLTYLVATLFLGGAVSPCPGEGNTDGADGDIVNVSDLTFLIANLFLGGPEPPPCDPGGDDINPDLLGNWEITAVTRNGISLPVSYVLDFQPGAVVATYSLSGDGQYLYEEKDASMATVWSESGRFAMAGDYSLSRHTAVNGMPYPGGYAVNKVAVNLSEMTLTTVEEGDILVFSLTR